MYERLQTNIVPFCFVYTYTICRGGLEVVACMGHTQEAEVVLGVVANLPSGGRRSSRVKAAACRAKFGAAACVSAQKMGFRFTKYLWMS
jgi:hypothetical protein